MTGRAPRAAWLVTPGRIPYDVAYEQMHMLVRRRIVEEIPDVLVLLEHPPVYTVGRRSDPSHLLLAEHELTGRGAELRFVDRGGSVTYHGPGQLVGYPIVHLGPAPDVIRYLRDLEEVIIQTCADLGVVVGRSERFTGVWAGDRKVCAIGVKTTRGVTLHGFALNCTTDLSWFDAIVPCGLIDRGVTSLSDLAGRRVTVEEALPLVAERFEAVFGTTLVPAPPQVREELSPTAATPA
jgi:lipoyl(octanoyl) transferase